MFTKKLVFLSFTLISLGFLASCDRDEFINRPEKVEQKETVSFDKETKISGKTMGTFYQVAVVGGFEGGEEALRNICEDLFNKICADISTFDKNSVLSKFNAFESTEPFKITKTLATYIEYCKRESLMLEGAMDISVGPLVNLWGFGPEARVEKAPDPMELDETKTYVGVDSYFLRYENSEPYLIKKDKRVKLDLSTVGEGLGADAVAAYLDANGYENYMVSVAGAIRSRGVNKKGQPWRFGIEDPKSHGQSVFAAVCPLGEALSTAGSYKNYFVDEKTGQRFSHIIDPKLGTPISHHTVSVSVIDRLAFTTDAIDTGLMVLGADKALEWAEKHNVAIYVIEMDSQGNAKGRYSRAFEPYLKCER